MVSHAHGQGYADLGFVIPETLEGMDVYKGPYFAEFGNLATAGAVNLRLREKFEHSFVKVQGGQFDTARVVLGWSPKRTRASGFVAVEGRYTNGPFLNEQNFQRLNLATRWNFDLAAGQNLSLLATGYEGSWNASGQVPLRLVEQGLLDRFAAVDPSEGGESSRYNFSILHEKLWHEQALHSQFYVVHYGLDLFSNFTFFLQDPVRGDGIAQSDDRQVAGGRVQYHRHQTVGALPGIFTVGLEYRQDFADVRLFRQEKRRLFQTWIDSRINERDLGLYVQEEIWLHPTLRSIVGLRHERFRFQVRDRLLGGRPDGLSRTFTGPKFSLIFSPRRSLSSEFYFNYGRGFHSNDARAAMADPSASLLAAGDGYEIGWRHLLGRKLELIAAYWLLDLEGELVWVGDEGTTELKGPSRRHGPELEARWNIHHDLWLDAGIYYSRAYFRDRMGFVPRAPRLVGKAGLSFAVESLTGNISFRHVGRHPLAEDNFVQAAGYTVTDFYLEYPLADRLRAILSIENLFDVEVKEAQTYFTSRLASEPHGVADNHFSPGYPFTLRLGLQYEF